MRTLATLILFAGATIMAQDKIEMRITVGPSTMDEPRPSPVVITETPTTRVLTHPNGQQYVIDRHDLAKLTVSLVGVNKADGKYTYRYSIHNTGAEKINQVYFYQPTAIVWFDRYGIKPQESRTISFVSDRPPSPTTMYVKTWDVIKEVERLDSGMRTIPADMCAELFAAVEAAGSAYSDSVKVAILGPK